jgi:hypothetical protein
VKTFPSSNNASAFSNVRERTGMVKGGEVFHISR